MCEVNALRPPEHKQRPRALQRAGQLPLQACYTVFLTLPERRSGTLVNATFDLPLQAADHEHLANNSLQHTSYGVGFYRVKAANLQRKPATGGAGVATWIYDGDDDALPPSDFFSPTGPPSRLRVPVAMLHSPTSTKTPRLPCFPSGGAR